MERLTGRDEGNAYFTECFEEPCLGMGCINENCEFLQLVCERLAAYEDIGPTPEQLLEIDKMYAEKCREVAELKKQNEAAISKMKSELERYYYFINDLQGNSPYNTGRAGAMQEALNIMRGVSE